MVLWAKAAVEIPATGTTTDGTDGDDGSTTGTTTDYDTSTGDDDTSSTGDQTDDTISSETGDNSTIALWIVLMLAAGAGLTGTVVYRRKRRCTK